MKRVLLVTSKHPSPSDSRDGGDATVSGIISALGKYCLLDILFFRDADEDIQIPSAGKIFFQNTNFAHYNSYSGHKGEKFLVRLQQAEISALRISDLAPNYDVIIIQHCMFILGLAEVDLDVFKKIILLPMFTACEYIKAGEFVPHDYIDAEREALKHVVKVIVPSETECRILTDNYGMKGAKIFVVPRSVMGINFMERTKCNRNLQMIYIASVRRQKSHMEAMKLFRLIKKDIPLARLHCTGTVQDENLFSECSDFLAENNLNSDVIFHGTLSSAELKSVLSSCDVNISVSLWETFGRGIFEGMAAGLPTVIMQRISSAADFPEHLRPLTVHSLHEMKSVILKLYSDKIFFNAESLKGLGVNKYLSFVRIHEILRGIILHS